MHHKQFLSCSSTHCARTQSKTPLRKSKSGSNLKVAQKIESESKSSCKSSRCKGACKLCFKCRTGKPRCRKCGAILGSPAEISRHRAPPADSQSRHSCWPCSRPHFMHAWSPREQRKGVPLAFPVQPWAKLKLKQYGTPFLLRADRPLRALGTAARFDLSGLSDFLSLGSESSDPELTGRFLVFLYGLSPPAPFGVGSRWKTTVASELIFWNKASRGFVPVASAWIFEPAASATSFHSSWSARITELTEGPSNPGGTGRFKCARKPCVTMSKAAKDTTPAWSAARARRVNACWRRSGQFKSRRMDESLDFTTSWLCSR